MKTPEEMTAYFRSMPSRTKENPYWKFSEEPLAVNAVCKMTEDVESADITLSASGIVPFNLNDSKQLLTTVKMFFRQYYDSFHSEAQVLCVTPEDAEKLSDIAIPILTKGKIGPFDVVVMVLPQDNHMGTSVISEWFWQNRIVGAGIKPVARIHSHHVLDPYQSMTDYSSLNSGTLEMVIGKIYQENLHVCYWLDVPGTDVKAQTFLATEEGSAFVIVPHIFNGPRACIGHTAVCE